MGIQKDEKMKKKSNLKIIPDDKYFENKDLKKLETFVKENSSKKVNIKKLIKQIKKG